MSDNKLNLIVRFSAIDKLSGGLKNIIGLGRTGGQALAGMQKHARDLEAQLAGVRRELGRATGNITGLMNRERELESQIQRTNQDIARRKQLLEFNAQLAKIEARGADLQARGQDNMIAGATLLAPMILAGKAAMDFSSGMVDIQQKANLTNRETRAMARNILAAADAAHQMPEAMRAAVDTLAGFGMDARQAAGLAGPIGRLGTAFKVDLADGAAAAYANINNLKLSINQTGKAFDIMAAGGNAGAFEIRDMARWFPQLTAQAQALGQSGTGAVADLTAALQIARRGTGSADAAANNIANLLAKINSPGTIRAFQKNFGVDLPAALQEAYRKGRTPLEAIAEITRKATGGDMSKIGFAFEDMQAQSGLRMLIQDLDDFKAMRGQIARADGAVNAAFSQREVQDASVAWNSFLATASMLAITLGTTLLPVTTRFLEIVNTVAGKVAAWAAENPRLAGALMTLVAGFAVARVGLGLLQFSFGGALTILARAAPILNMARVAFLFLGRGVMQAGMMMMANPIVALIVGIGLAIGVVAYLVYSNWDKIVAAFNAGIAWVKNLLDGVPGWMKSIGSAMMQGLLASINPLLLVRKLLAVAKAGVAAFKNYFGIKSPSRLFMEMGGHIAGGMAIGIDRGGKRPLQAMARLATGVAGAGSLAMGGAGMASPAASGSRSPPITIHIHQRAGEDARALAERVAMVLDERRRTARLSSYADDF